MNRPLPGHYQRHPCTAGCGRKGGDKYPFYCELCALFESYRKERWDRMLRNNGTNPCYRKLGDPMPDGWRPTDLMIFHGKNRGYNSIVVRSYLNKRTQNSLKDFAEDR